MSDDKKIVINCPLCSKKELHVSTAKNGLQQCISCGYSTNEDFCISDVKFENEKFKTLDEFMKKYSVEENGYIWIPSVMQLPIGIYYPSEKDDKLIWFFAPLVDIPEEDQKNYPNPNRGSSLTSNWGSTSCVFTHSLDFRGSLII